MTTPKMGLAQPQPGITNDLIAAQNIVDNFGVIDDHDHSPGKGGLVPTAGLNINANLGFNNFQARDLQASNYASLTGALSGASNNRSLFVLGNELVFRDGVGNTVTLTSGGSVAGASGTITGLTGAAQVTYVAPTINFVQDATSRRMLVEHGDVRLFPDVSSPAQNVRLRVPTTLSTTYTLTLPNAVPPALRYLSVDGAGDVSYSTGDDVLTASTSTGANSVIDKYTRTTGTSVGARGVAIGTSTGTFSTTSTSFVDITNATVTITTSGRPVYIVVVPVADINFSYMQLSDSGLANVATISLFADIQCLRGATNIGRHRITNSLTINTNDIDDLGINIPYGSLVWVDVVSAGTYTYKLQARVGTNNDLGFRHANLVAYEL